MNGLLENQNIGSGGGGFSFGGGGSIGAFLVGALLARNGTFGGGGGSEVNNINEAIFATQTLSKLGTIEGSIPLGALSTQNALLEQTIGINNGLSNVKDSVQNGTSAVLLNANNNTNQILGAICELGSKIDANTITDLQRQLGVAQSAILDERHERRSKEVEVNVSQNVNQVQAQAQAQQQQQQQFAQLFTLFNHLAGDIQAVKQGQVIFNSGTMAASGTQAAANTKVA